MTDQRPPRDDLVRAVPPGVEIRSSDDGGPTVMAGHFSVFNQWTRIDSSWEGRFLERIAPGAFTKAFRESTPKVLFQHGKDPQIGDKPLGTIRSLTEDGNGAAYEVELLDTAYVRDLVPGLKAGLYGASFRFSVVKEDFNKSPARSAHNPEGLPERTVLEARVPEFGPVTFPAYAGATAGIRSMTDEFLISRLAADPERLAALLTTALPARAEAEPHSDTGEPPPLPEPPPIEEARATQDPPNGGSSDSKENTVSEYITRDEKASRVTELRSSITRRAVEFDGVFPPDVQAIDDAENKEHDALVRDIEAWDARQARIRALTEDPGKVETPGGFSPPSVIRKQSMEDIHDLGRIRNETRSRDEFDAKVRENALRSIDSARLSRNSSADELVDIVTYRDEGEEGTGEIARRVLLTGAPAYRRAFNKYLRGERDLWTPEEARAAALAVTGTTTTGGYAVPYIFDPTIIRVGAYTATNPFRQACRVETITNGNNWRTVTVGAVTTTYITEAGAATEQGPTFAQPTYTVQSAHAFATVSHETMQDRPDIGDELGMVFAESKATYEENQFAVGAGTTVYPMGMFTDTAYTNQDTATNDTTALLDFSVVEAALPLRFRANAAWFMNRSTIRQLLILDTTYRYFSGAGIQFQGPQANSTGPQIGSTTGGNTGLYLLGYPVWEVPSAVSTLTTDGAIIAVLCDPKTYIIVDRMGMTIEVIPNMLNGATPSFPTGQRGIYARFRNTAKPLLADGGRSLSVQ